VWGLTKIGRGPSDECFEDSSAALVRDVLPHEAAACFARVRRYVAWIAEHKGISPPLVVSVLDALAVAVCRSA
jgi:hypothetical protein